MSLTHLLAALPEPLFSAYEVEGVLGVGAYAIVYQIRSVETDEAFALKVVEKEPMRKRSMMPQLDREVALLSVPYSPHVIQLLEVLHTSSHVFLRFELCDTTVEDALNQSGPMSEEEAYSWFRQLCLGIQALHVHGVIHRDLKPSNFLLDGRGVLRICDFGWACHESDHLSGNCGTPQYSPPECIGRPSYVHTPKVDIYGLGACLQHMLLGRVPMGREDVPKGLSEETIELLHELMDPDPDLRPCIEDVLNRPQLANGIPFAEHFTNLWRNLSDFMDIPAPQKAARKKPMMETSCGFGLFI